MSIVKEFTGGRWWEIEEDYLEGRMGSREALVKQFAHVHTPEDEILDFVDATARLDPHFQTFQDFCKEKGIPLAVVSEGLDFYIGHLFHKFVIEVKVYTNHAVFAGKGISVEFPNSSEDCDSCGTCKRDKVRELAVHRKVVYIGNGMSDLCAAREADIIFAKDSLSKLLAEEEVEHIVYGDFGDIIRELEGIV